MTMKKSIPCSLCGNQAGYFDTVRERDYYDCATCGAILMDPEHYVSRKAEKSRYETHDNDVNDPRYQNFVKPLVEAVRDEYSPPAAGLDYGAGTGPVAAHLLQEAGFDITTFDPFFLPRAEVFRRDFDFIIASEVVEHFYQPAKEYRLLKSLLRPGGRLYCMTLPYRDELDFQNWHYNHDETHVIFYREQTARWISRSFGFSGLDIGERLFVLQK